MPNPSFEEYDTCPNALSQIKRAIGWYSAKPTPDYFNLCSSSLNSGVPSNYFGTQYPSSGNGYAGFAAMYGGVMNLREFVGIRLLDTLQVGIRYYLSFKVSRAYNPAFLNDCSVNKIGALFSTAQYSDTNNAPVCNCSQVYTNQLITDSANWTTINGAYTADSNYLYLNLGNFFTNDLTDSILRQGEFCNAYYYIDEICLSTDSLYVQNYSSNNSLPTETVRASISYFPNPTNDNVTISITDRSINCIKLYNVLGELLKLYSHIDTETYAIDIGDLSQGNYFLVINEANSSNSTFIITKL